MSSKLARKRELERIAQRELRITRQHSTATADQISAESHVMRAERVFTQRSRVVRKRKLHTRNAQRMQSFTISDQRDSYTSRDIVTTDSYVLCSRSELALVDVSDATRLAATQCDLIMSSHALHNVNCTCTESE